MTNSFGARSTLQVGETSYEIYRIDALQSQFDVARLPYSLKVLLENVLRTEDGGDITAADAEAIASWVAPAAPSAEVSFTPARVLLQDFTGVPAIVDLAAMRHAMGELGGDATKINPLLPVELVIDHSVQVDEFGSRFAFARNTELEFERNRERYAFLRWGQEAFDNFKAVPPGTGIVHQINLEYLARVVESREIGGVLQAFPDTLVGTDSHTTMINGLGVLGWGVGGIEAEAAMLGETLSMLVPQVVGFKLHGDLPEGATATDLVLTVTQVLRETGVVGKFVEYFGPGLVGLPLADRATIANMSPEYGATCGFFPVDEETLTYLALTGRDAQQIALVEAYSKEQGLFHDPNEAATYSQVVELDLSTVEPSIAGPKRPQDRISLSRAKTSFFDSLPSLGVADGASNGVTASTAVAVKKDAATFDLNHGAVVIAAITSCTNTSNPAVMVAAGLVARNAIKRGMNVKPWVKTSLAPGSKVVTSYLEEAGLQTDLDALGFNLVGYGCTTCIGNAGPLPPAISDAIEAGDLVACAVLSGNRNFEARIHPDIKANYLASPPLVVAYALAGRMDIDITSEPLAQDSDGNDVYLADLWPTPAEVQETVASSLKSEMFSISYADVFSGDAQWNGLEIPTGELYDWQDDSTYVRRPPFFDGMPREPGSIPDITGARCLVKLGDSVTTDHISPAGAIKPTAPAGQYLIEQGVEQGNFNSYGSRRGNHEVMMRGTFANVRLRNELVPGSEGTATIHFPSGEEVSIYEGALRYADDETSLIVLAGAEYGSGSSRDWAAKGTSLLGVKAVIATSFERIHRSNLVGLGVLPLEFADGQTSETLGLSGRETFAIGGIQNGEATEATVTASLDGDEAKSFKVRIRLDTPRERDYVRHGGILPYVLRRLLND
jgi:aconitate hydratase